MICTQNRIRRCVLLTRGWFFTNHLSYSWETDHNRLHYGIVWTGLDQFAVDSVEGGQNRSGTIQNSSQRTIPEWFCSVNLLIKTYDHLIETYF